jgi:hypothetical protein
VNLRKDHYHIDLGGGCVACVPGGVYYNTPCDALLAAHALPITPRHSCPGIGVFEARIGGESVAVVERRLQSV